MMSGYMKRIAVAGYTVYQVRRKPNLPEGYTMKDMADDYAGMIKDELGGPVDVMGLSTGGTIAQQFAADHPDLVRRLVLASTGYRLNKNGRALQRKLAELVKEGKYRTGAALMADALATGLMHFFLKRILWLMGRSMFSPGGKITDGLVEIEAEDRFDFKDRLVEIKAPTLVIGGDRDFFYHPISDTAAGIPGAELVLYAGVGHGAIMKRKFTTDVLAFLFR
jgi:pimeloyl-ACP methyl ester carboxylesterase